MVFIYTVFTVADTLSLEVCFLLIQVCLCTHQLGMASDYIEFLEGQYFKSGNGIRGDELSVDGRLEYYRSKLFLFKASLSVLSGNIKICKKELKNLTNTVGNVSRLNDVTLGRCSLILMPRCTCARRVYSVGFVC